MMRFNTALITGAASGLGQAVAQRLSHSVAHVLLWDRNVEGLETTRALCTASRVTAQRVDLSDGAAVASAVDMLKANAEIPDLIFHAAGILTTGDLSRVTAEDCRRMMDVNYMGTVHLLLAVQPHLRKGARVLCVSSVAGLKGLPEFAAYCASKFAVLGFCESIHHELKQRGIHLSVICPPAVDTPMVQNLTHRPVLYDIFPFAEKAKVVSRIEEATRETGGFLVLIDAQSRLLKSVNGVFPALTGNVLGRLVDRFQAQRRGTP